MLVPVTWRVRQQPVLDAGCCGHDLVGADSARVVLRIADVAERSRRQRMIRGQRRNCCNVVGPPSRSDHRLTVRRVSPVTR